MHHNLKNTCADPLHHIGVKASLWKTSGDTVGLARVTDTAADHYVGEPG